MSPEGKSHACTDITGEDYADHEIPTGEDHADHEIPSHQAGLARRLPARACSLRATGGRAETAGADPGARSGDGAGVAASRHWSLLRTNSAADRPEEVEAGTPIIYANGQPIARSEPGAASYRDLPPGTYRFTVQPLSGIPTGYKDKVRLAPGTHAYLEIQWGPSWQEPAEGRRGWLVPVSVSG